MPVNLSSTGTRAGDMVGELPRREGRGLPAHAAANPAR